MTYVVLVFGVQHNGWIFVYKEKYFIIKLARWGREERRMRKGI